MGQPKSRLGMDAFGAEHDSVCGVTKEKARGWLDFEEMHFWDNYSPALLRKLEGNISSRGVADLFNTFSITKDGNPPRMKPR